MTGFLAALAAVVAMIAPAAPPAGGVADYQLGGAYPPAESTDIVVRDSTEEPVEDVYSVCYVNAFQTQPGSLSWWKKHHPTLLLRTKAKKLVRDPGWRDEILLDLRTAGKQAAAASVMRTWFDRCAADGFQAIEPDNLDSWTRSKGLLRAGHAKAYAKRLTQHAHAAGLAIAQKNAPELSGKALGFDFAIAEECEVYRECGAYTEVYGRHVLEIEYTDNGRTAYTRACRARAGQISIMLRDRDVVPRGASGYVFRTC